MKKVEKATGGLKKRIRDRMRSVNKKVMAIALAGRQKGPGGEERRVEGYRELLSLTRKILHQAEGVLGEMQDLPSRRQSRLKPLREILETMSGRVRQVIRQTKARVFQGITPYPDKIQRVFEPHTEIIRKGKMSKPGTASSSISVGPLASSTPPVTLATLTAAASPLTQQGSIVGTYQYMAPEVLQGAARAVIFSASDASSMMEGP